MRTRTSQQEAKIRAGSDDLHLISSGISNIGRGEVEDVPETVRFMIVVLVFLVRSGLLMPVVLSLCGHSHGQCGQGKDEGSETHIEFSKVMEVWMFMEFESSTKTGSRYVQQTFRYIY
jgi:hypothetical protein